MSRIHPADQAKCQTSLSKQKAADHIESHLRPTVLTVWKRSSMSFQGTDGFTVFDRQGRLVFRVDNYSRKIPCVAAGGLVLMDGAGNALLTLKPQVLSMQCQWNAYRGEDVCGKGSRSKVFSMRNPTLLFQGSKDAAEVFMEGPTKQGHTPDFSVEGSFRMRSCKIKTSFGQVAAHITRKRVNSTILLSDEVFNLVVQPGFDTQLIMAFVLVLDRICSKSFTPLLCS